MTTVALLLREGRAALAAAAIEQPRREARILLEAATGLDRSALLTSDGWKVGADTEAHYRAWIARRAHREPMAYILGSVEFWSLDFAAAPGVLVPRADSETLIEAAIARFQDQSRPLRLLDIGVGTGCLLLTLLHHYREASGVGTDLSPAALTCAAGNAQRLGVADRLELVATSWASGVAGPFDLVVSNPPYIRSAEIATLQPEVACYEPRLALDGGADGLDAYRAILGGLPRLLATEGIVILELGHDQLADVTALATRAGYTAMAHSDLAGIARCLILVPARRATARPAWLRGLPLLALLAACGGAAESTEAPALPNPAARHCVEQGGKSEIVQEPGGWRGVCRFPDGRACDEWQFPRAGICSG